MDRTPNWAIPPASLELQTLNKTETRTRVDADSEPWSQTREPGAQVCSTCRSRTWKGDRLPGHSRDTSTPRLSPTQGLEVGVRQD